MAKPWTGGSDGTLLMALILTVSPFHHHRPRNPNFRALEFDVHQGHFVVDVRQRCPQNPAGRRLP